MPNGHSDLTSSRYFIEETEMMWVDHEYRRLHPDQDLIDYESALCWSNAEQQLREDVEIEVLWNKITIDALDASLALEIRGIEVDNFVIACKVARTHGVDWGDSRKHSNDVGGVPMVIYAVEELLNRNSRAEAIS